MQQQQQQKSDSIKYNLKEFKSIYDTKGSQPKKIILNPGKFKMPVLTTVINLKEFIKKNITSTHIAAYHNIPDATKLKKSEYLKRLMIKLNLIEDKVMFFKILDKDNTIMKDEMISLKNILKDKFKSKPFNNKVNDMMLKEIENYFCEDINGNHKYNLTNLSSFSKKK